MHLHHIVPRHMGGSDDPTNLIEVSVEEHANLHLDLYLKYGRWQDWLAANGLAGIIDREEICREISRQNGKNSKRPGYKHSDETKAKMSRSHIGKHKHTKESKQLLREINTGKKLSEDIKRKIRESMIGDPRLSANKGRKWYTNGTENIFTHESLPSPEWRRGRIINSSKN